MQIVILNGGKGTRVKSVSKNKPKCMINFNKKPFISHQINLLKKKDLKKYFFAWGIKLKLLLNI